MVYFYLVPINAIFYKLIGCHVVFIIKKDAKNDFVFKLLIETLLQSVLST